MKHDLCKLHLRGARIDYYKHFKSYVKLAVSKFKISDNYIDYEVRVNDGKSFNKVVGTSSCCSYDAKYKALYNLVHKDLEVPTYE